MFTIHQVKRAAFCKMIQNMALCLLVWVVQDGFMAFSVGSTKLPYFAELLFLIMILKYGEPWILGNSSD